MGTTRCMIHKHRKIKSIVWIIVVITITFLVSLNDSKATAQNTMQTNPVNMNIQDLESKINQITRDYINKRENIALTVGVIRQGHSFIKGFGQFSDADPSLPNAQTIYEIGSVTKVFTGIALAKLVNDGVVILDDPIYLYLPREVVNQLPDAIQAITLRQLATHTSGVPRLPNSFLANIKDPTNPYIHYTKQDLYAALAETNLLNEPGNYEYSNFGMGLLGHLLSLKTSQSYENLIETIVCQPLSMPDTTIHLTPEQQQRFTPGHSPDGTLTSNWDFDVLASAGAFRSTAKDLLTFLQANMRESDPWRMTIASSQERYFETDNFSLGLAWHISTLPNGQVVHWHNGGTGGYKSFIGFDKTNQTGIVILSNYGDAFANDNSVDEMANSILMELSAQ